ncbi:ATP-binding protein [Insolitispirillum peregrinum]|uniref:Molecular chaperone, HSP90 family n=1 Tax=Insolitispirillum peregrinum TaxID=80876 RepID=A0A1N7MTC1_9PROT|nr:ATP-binding protein [Insolitispirillum peregrinum]SIS89375.1 Molecular chaperone, HSP90 family [Insolitispirillum peregrinum]
MIDFKGFVRFMRSLFNDVSIFRRELIQNALEACRQAEVRHGFSKCLISISVDSDEGVFSISDNGVGMTADELRTNLTVLFRSHWPSSEDGSLGIGQFGFGFHAVFLVADRIKVVSRSRCSPDEAHEMDFLSDQGVDIRPIVGNLPGFGTTITLWLRDDVRHLLDEDDTRNDLEKTFLYTHYPIHLNGMNVGLRRPDGWSHPIFSGDQANVEAWLMRRYGWDEPPLAIGSVKFGNGGWIAIAAGPERVPALEVYRRGIRVVQQELIPKPLNVMVCGVIDVQDCELKPDRETLVVDGAHRRMIAAIREAIIAMLSDLGRHQPDIVAQLFDHYRQVIVAALGSSEELMRTMGPRLPVKVFGADEKSPLAEVLDGLERLVWVKDPARDRVFADRARRLGWRPVLLLDSDERELVCRVCDTMAIPHVSVAEEFLAEMKRKVTPSALVPLFRGVVPADWEVICCEDVDARMPLTVVRLATERESGIGGLLFDALRAMMEKEGMSGFADRQDKTIAILNKRNPVMARLEQRGTHSHADRELARILFFSGRLACDSKISVGEMDEFLDSLADYFNSSAA